MKGYKYQLTNNEKHITKNLHVKLHYGIEATLLIFKRFFYLNLFKVNWQMKVYPIRNPKWVVSYNQESTAVFAILIFCLNIRNSSNMDLKLHSIPEIFIFPSIYPLDNLRLNRRCFWTQISVPGDLNSRFDFIPRIAKPLIRTP